MEKFSLQKKFYRKAFFMNFVTKKQKNENKKGTREKKSWKRESGSHTTLLKSEKEKVFGKSTRMKAFCE